MGDDLGDAVSKNPASEASDSGPGSENVASQAAARAAIAPLSEVERKRLQQNFQRGEQNFNRNIDYAIEMFNLCVLGDPANLIYLQSLLGAIRKKHSGKSRGGLAGVFSAGGRAKVRKLAAAEKYQEAIQAAPTIRKGPTSRRHSTWCPRTSKSIDSARNLPPIMVTTTKPSPAGSA
jgi:hypothetical protein